MLISLAFVFYYLFKFWHHDQVCDPRMEPIQKLQTVITILLVSQKSGLKQGWNWLFFQLFARICINDKWHVNQCIYQTKEKHLHFVFTWLQQKWFCRLQETGHICCQYSKNYSYIYFEKPSRIPKKELWSPNTCYLTYNKEHLLMQICMVLDDLHGFANLLINKDVDEHQHIPISKHVTEGLLLHHKQLVNKVAAVLLDPKRVCQATVDTIYVMFLKLNSYTELLYASYGELAFLEVIQWHSSWFHL